MTETIIENLSGRKLMALVTFLLLCQITCFLVGGLIAPKPGSFQNILGTVCEDTSIKDNYTNKWFYKAGIGKCHPVNISDVHRQNLSVTDLVYVFQMPISRESTVSEFLRWQQSLIGVLQIDMRNQYQMKNRSLVTIDARLAYRNKGDPEDEWKLYAESIEKRNIECEAEEDSYENVTKCAAVPLFELNSLPHEYYLLNIRLLKVERETKEDSVQEISLALISQNETFTKVWVSLKTVFFFTFIITLCWFYRRIHILKRKFYFLEVMLFSLGITTCTLNLPLEYLLFIIDMPLMLLLADIRQFVFYVKLLSLWLVLSGEHMLVQAKSTLKKYWRNVLAVFLGCIIIFIFDIYERGVQLKYPFYSIWMTDLWSNSDLALIFLVISRILIGIYFLYLCYSVWRVFRDIHRERRRYLFAPMSYMRRLHYEGLYDKIIFRLKCLMVVSMVCAALTLTGIILGQVADWKIYENIKLEYTSAFFTGVYGMWNLYIFALLVLYAPSQKRWDDVDNHCASLNGNLEF